MVELRWKIVEDGIVCGIVSKKKVLQYRLLKVTTINECLQTESDWIDVPEVREKEGG